MHRATRSLVVLGVLLICGCGAKLPEKPKENLVPASGTVTVNGKPAAGVFISFIPVKNNNDSRGGTAITDDQGQFQLKNYMKLDGVPAGEYVAVFSLLESAEKSNLPKTSRPVPGVTTKEKIPALWSNPEKRGTHNLVDIPAAGKTDLKFDIPLK